MRNQEALSRSPSRLLWLLAVDSLLAKVEAVVASVIFILMLAFMLVQVTARYFFEAPLPWSEELIRYLFVGSSFIGAAAVCKYREHIEINLVDTILARVGPRRRARVLRMQQMTADALSLLTLAIFGWYSYGFVAKLLAGNQRSPAMDFPTYIVAGAMLLGVCLMILHYLVKLLESALNGARAEEAQ